MCIYQLAKMAGVKFDAHYNVTGIDPPELIYFIREHYPDVKFERPSITMWRLIEKKGMPPTRLIRFCCEHLKERGGKNRFVITGVRWAESVRRKKQRTVIEVNAYSKSRMLTNDNNEARRMIEDCTERGKHILNPIIDWTDDDVWEFIFANKLPYCSLYDEGFSRIGCIGCPMAGPKGMEREFARYPKFKGLYLKAFARMIETRKKKGLSCDSFTSPEAVMAWWMYGSDKKQQKSLEGQIELFEEEPPD